MAINTTFKDLLDAGVHFGSPSAKWHPLMKPYIYGEVNRLHLVNLRETLKGLIRATHYLENLTASGKKVLFVGTSRQGREIVRTEAKRAGGFFVVHRWLGGTLTNMNTMRKRIARLNELEGLEASGEIEKFSKKMISNLTREKKKVFRNFEGIRDMEVAPGAMVIVDPKREANAVAEAIKLNVPIVALTDTDTDPTPIDFIVPGNDDSQRSIQLIVGLLADAVELGSKKAAANAVAINAARQKEREGGRRRERGKAPEINVEVPANLAELGAFTMPDEA
ncbi:30S ribosomal protein S2 [Planctomycetales bacterium]|nr:30S ribosomal protein S2 [Planctomycetales bacterium]GHT07735.1 30S ribosomal protein S2 [Planctomycetales bacterium]GHV22450.1 30S ribosomal protein S2 [Planctomycetales bacterium]